MVTRVFKFEPPNLVTLGKIIGFSTPLVFGPWPLTLGNQSVFAAPILVVGPPLAR